MVTVWPDTAIQRVSTKVRNLTRPVVGSRVGKGGVPKVKSLRGGMAPIQVGTVVFHILGIAW
jgi:hypothetical protein